MSKQNLFNSPIRMDITLPKGYFVLGAGTEKLSNLKGISKLVQRLEKANVVLSSDAITALMTLDELTFNVISHDLLLRNKAVKGAFLRPSFATGEDISAEVFTFDDFLTQMEMYFFTYGLGVVPEHMFESAKGRKIEVDNIVKRDEKKELNCTFRIIDIKNIDGFVSDVATIVGSPIVFGSQQLEFVQEAFDKGLITNVFEKVQAMKVKENIFAILEITGKEVFKELNILRTATDVLRYAYFVSDLDYRNLEKGAKFTLKTSDKKVVMSALDKISDKDIINVFGDMKPYKSQWLGLSKNVFPGSKKFSKYTKAQEVFYYIRNNTEIRTFNTITSELIASKEYIKLARHLSEKPGALLRSLDMIIRNLEKGESKVLVTIIEGIDLNPKLIIQVRKWLDYRTKNELASRTFNIKGKPVTVEDKPLKALKEKRTLKVTTALRGIMVNHLQGKDLFSKQIETINKSLEAQKTAE